jgi:Cys/Met metabolism PLP-dependent enzyme
MTHCTTAGTPVGVSDGLLRLSIGLEDDDELIADLSRALAGWARCAGRLADGTDAELHGRLRLDHKSVNC